MDFLILTELCIHLETEFSQLDLDASFIQNGGHSLTAATLVAACKAQGCHLTIGKVLTSDSLREVLRSAQPFTSSDSVPELTSGTGSGKSLQQSTKSSTQQQNISYHNDDRTPQGFDDSLSQGPPVGGLVVLNESQEHTLADEYSPSPETQWIPAQIEGPSIIERRSTPNPQSLTNSSREAQMLDPDYDTPTEMQMSLIHGTLKTPGMNIITHFETYYSDHIPVMKAAWKTVIEMEPIFQAVTLSKFLEEDRKVFDWYDATSVHQGDPGAIKKLCKESRIGSFFRVVPCRTAPGQRSRSTIIWIVHHSLIDGYSASLVFDKVRKVANGLNVLPGPPFWRLAKDLESFQQLHRDEGNAYWQKKLEQYNGAKTELLLPFVDEGSDQAGSAEVVSDLSSIVEELQSITRAINVTPAAFFNAAWALVLATYADSDLVVFGAVLSGRNLPLPNVAGVVGPLVNTLPLFVNIERTVSVKEFVRLVFESLTELAEFQWTKPCNGFSRNFESALSIQFAQPKHLQGAFSPIESPHTHQATEIPLSIALEADGKLRVQYHRNRFSPKNINKVISCYREALQLLLQGHATIDATMEGLLSCPSKALLSRYGNCLSGLTTKTSVKNDLVTLFEMTVRNFPENVAIERGDFSITYRDFHHAASRLALQLARHISPGDVICVHSDRSVNWLIAIYSILKAGGVYCSLDSALPSELRNSMYSLAGAMVYLTPSTSQLHLAPVDCELCISVEGALDEFDDQDAAVLEHRKEPEPWSTAYLCFTSGSTGTPKGVLCTHEGLVAFQSDLQVRLFALPGIRIAQIMSAAFDGSIHEIFSALSYGATLVLQSGADPFAHLDSADSAILTPSIARVLNPEDYKRLSKVYLVGEPVPQAVADKWSKHKQLYNMYGPTEGTCGATIKRLSHGSPVTIGRPNPTTRIYLLNSRKVMALPGMIGEIYLAGVQIAKGYLNLPNETKDRFLTDTICRNGEQMYKTGDRGYWNELGEIVCLGRNDRQIKLRGYRLDMNDLEIRIAKAMPTLEGIAISRRGDHLVAMVQPASTDTKDLLSRVAAIIPSYALPQQIIAVDQLPTTSAGKIDYAAISRNSTAISIREAGIPRTATERAVAGAFRSILNLGEDTTVTLGSSFVDLGGHSLQQLSLAKLLTKTFDLQIPLRLIIERPGLGDLAKGIDDHKTAHKPITPPTYSLGQQQVSPIENEWLQKYDVDAGSSCFNVSFISSFDGRAVDRRVLTEAWNTVLARHKLLRSKYVSRRARPPIRRFASCAPQAERVDRLDLWAEVNRPFQVDRTNPARVFVTKDRLIVILSHIVADYTTLAILLREASAVYNGQQLEPISRSYSDVDVWYRNVPPCYLDFWSTYLKDCPGSPLILGRQQERSGCRGISTVSSIDSHAFQGMLQFSQNAKISLHQLVTGAVAICLQLDSPETDIVVGNPYMNRNSDEDLETVGLFLEPLPIRIKYGLPSDDSTNEVPETYIQAVRRSSQAALANVMPWHQLLDHLSIRPTYPDHPLLDVMVSFHDHRQSVDLEMAAPDFESCFIWSEGAKFKLMCEFTAISDTKLLLRLEHDTECISASEIQRIQTLIPQALALLSQSIPHDEIKRRLSAGEESTYHQVMDTNQIFGKRLCDIE